MPWSDGRLSVPCIAHGEMDVLHSIGPLAGTAVRWTGAWVGRSKGVLVVLQTTPTHSLPPDIPKETLQAQPLSKSLMVADACPGKGGALTRFLFCWPPAFTDPRSPLLQRRAFMPLPDLSGDRRPFKRNILSGRRFDKHRQKHLSAPSHHLLMYRCVNGIDSIFIFNRMPPSASR
jgi:hypothetical protein